MPGIFPGEQRDNKRPPLFHERLPIGEASEISALRPRLRIPESLPNGVGKHAVEKRDCAIAPEYSVFPRLFAHNLIEHRRIARDLLISIPREKQHRIADGGKRAVWQALSASRLVIPLEPIARLLQKNALIGQQFKLPPRKAVLQICRRICDNPAPAILLSIPSAHQEKDSFSWLQAISRSIASSV